MVKFTGKSQTLTMNGGTAGTKFCVTGVDYDLDVDIYKAACAGGSHKVTVAGQNDTTATVNWYADAGELDALLAASGTFERGATAADWAHNPEGAGAGNPTITSTKITIGRTSLGIPVEGIVGGTTTVHFDAWTIAALGA